MVTEKLTEKLFDPKAYADKEFSIQSTVKSFLNYCRARHQIPRTGGIPFNKYERLVLNYCKTKDVESLEKLSKKDLVELADVFGDYFNLPNGGSEERERKILRSGLATIYIAYHYKTQGNKPTGKTPSLEKIVKSLPQYSLPTAATVIAENN
jgi:hypothetical protein